MQNNTFQAVLASDNESKTSFILFLYGEIQWSTGDDLPNGVYKTIIMHNNIIILLPIIYTQPKDKCRCQLQLV